MPVTKETLFLIEQGQAGITRTLWYSTATASLLEAARSLAEALRKDSSLPIRIRRVDIVRTSEVLAEWDHGEPVNESGVPS